MTRFYSNSKKELIYNRKLLLEHWLELKHKGVDDKTLQAVLKISRTTFFRWNKAYNSHGLYGLKPKSTRPCRVRQPSVLTKDVLATIRTLREQRPFFGKAKIHALCIAQGLPISLSSVGRALHYLTKRGIVTPVVVLKCNKQRKFTNYKNPRRNSGVFVRYPIKKSTSYIDHLVCLKFSSSWPGINRGHVRY